MFIKCQNTPILSSTCGLSPFEHAPLPSQHASAARFPWTHSCNSLNSSPRPVSPWWRPHLLLNTLSCLLLMTPPPPPEHFVLPPPDYTPTSSWTLVPASPRWRPWALSRVSCVQPCSTKDGGTSISIWTLVQILIIAAFYTTGKGVNRGGEAIGHHALQPIFYLISRAAVSMFAKLIALIKLNIMYNPTRYTLPSCSMSPRKKWR